MRRIGTNLVRSCPDSAFLALLRVPIRAEARCQGRPGQPPGGPLDISNRRDSDIHLIRHSYQNHHHDC